VWTEADGGIFRRNGSPFQYKHCSKPSSPRVIEISALVRSKTRANLFLGDRSLAKPYDGMCNMIPNGHNPHRILGTMIVIVQTRPTPVMSTLTRQEAKVEINVFADVRKRMAKAEKRMHDIGVQPRCMHLTRCGSDLLRLVGTATIS
jgi:hypothetical protein